MTCRDLLENTQKNSNTPRAGGAICIMGFSSVEMDPLKDALGKKLPHQPAIRALARERKLMPRKLSTIAPDWWDYTTLDSAIIRDAASLMPRQMEKLARPGFRVVMYDTLEDFYLAEALEYITAWKQSTPDNPVGICGPIGPTEQLPLVARLVNSLGLNLRSAHFWGMDEWYDGKREVSVEPSAFV